MTIFVSTCMIFPCLGLSDSFCPRGGFNNVQPQFGPGCMYRCHCVGDVQCDNVTGLCPVESAAGWMGPGCQHRDIAYRKQVHQVLYDSSLLMDGSNATDGLIASCNGPTTWMAVDLNDTYRISGLVITSSMGDTPGCIRILVVLQDFGVTVRNSSFDPHTDIAQTCFKQNTTEKLNTEIHVVCATEIVGRYLVIRTRDNATIMTLCDVRVYGDCQNNVCGWTCDTYCYCDGPIDKENKIHAKCPGKCITGYWGHSCNNTCDTNCIGNIRNQTDGQCMECVRGKWGHLCKNNCSNCLNGTGCGISNGICTVGCSLGSSDVNCSEPCGHCAGDGYCNRLTRACIHGCQPGWQDEHCSIACKPGWYGFDCSNKCGNCANITCDFVNGTCYFDCSEGYNGIGCLKRLALNENSNLCEFSTQIIGIIVDVFMCALLIGIAVGYFLMRIHMLRSASASATSARLEGTYDQLDLDKVQNDSSLEYEKLQMETRMKH